MRIEFLGYELVFRNIRGNKDQMVSIPLKDYKRMQREIQIMRLQT